MRPLWISYFGLENQAELLSVGGDVWFDRIHAQRERQSGKQLKEDELDEALDQIGKGD